MAEPAPATENNEARRIEMLRAAAELICERGFGDTRIADVAKRAGVSSALVIYYFGTRDRLLVDALRYSEESFYEAAEQMLAEVPSLRERLSLLIKWTCVPEARRRDTRRLGPVVRPVGAGVPARRDQGGPGRTRRALAQDDRRRGRSRPNSSSDVDVRMFALEFAALLDGLSIQVALDDPEVDSDRGLRHRDALRRAGTEPAAREEAAERQGEGRQEGLSAPTCSATGSAIGTRRAAVQHPHRVVGADAVDPFAPGSWVTEPGPAWLGTSTISAVGAPTSTCTCVQLPR